MFIYRIINNINGMSYIGKSIDVEQRFKGHIRESRLERSKNRKLYIAIREFGEENFSCEILENTKDKDRERYWIKKYNTYHDGYNHTRDGQGNKGVNKEPTRVITKEMIDIAVKEYSKRPNLRNSSKISKIPEYKLRAILNEHM